MSTQSDFIKICRTCVLENENMTTINSPQILEMLHLCTAVKMEQTDGLPHQICSKCLSSLNAAYEFWQKTEKNERILNDILSKSKNETAEQAVSTDDNVDSEADDFQSDELKVENDRFDESKQEKCKEGLDSCNNNYKCDVCNKILINNYSLVRHLETHSKNRRYSHSCPICKKKFYEKGNLTKHLLRHNGEKRYNCEHCDKSFYELSLLALHVKQHNVKPIQCQVCRKQFMLQLQLDNHLKNHIEFKHFCKTCNKGFRELNLLKKHEISHNGAVFPCSKCDKWFKYELSLEKHFQNFHEGKRKQEVCKLCGKTVAGLKNHTIMMHSEKPHYCSQCDKSFAVLTLLRRHIRSTHGSPKKKDICTACGKEVVALKHHMLVVHSTERPYKCKECGIGFAAISLLNNHTKVHTGETRLYKVLCTTCGKKFQTMTCLRIHMRTHTGERPLACPMCDKKYKTLSALAVHKHSHTNERPHECTVCHKRFFTVTLLKKHMLVHTGEKPYQCTVCNRGFTQSYKLKTHMKTH